MITIIIAITFLLGLYVGTIRGMEVKRLRVRDISRKVRDVNWPTHRLGKRRFVVAVLNRIVTGIVIVIPVYMVADCNKSVWWFLLYLLLILFEFNLFRIEQV